MAYSDVQCLRAREDFPALSRSVDGRPLTFLDGPAGTQVPKPVIEAQAHAYRTFNTNTGGEFLTSRDLEEAMWRTRETVATFVGATEPVSSQQSAIGFMKAADRGSVMASFPLTGPIPSRIIYC